MNDILTQYKRINENIIVCHNKNETPYITVPHLHSQYEIYYNINGAKGFMLNGNFIKCSKRDLIAIPKVQAHKVIVKKNTEYERCIINISDYITDLIEILCHSENILSWLKGTNDNTARTVNLSEKHHAVFLSLIDRYCEYESKNDSLKALSVFIKILSFLKDRFENPKHTEYIDDNDLSYPDRIMKIIEQNFKTASVADISEKIFVNEDYANRMFKEETGMTIKQYLTIRKIAEAKKYIFLGRSAKDACILSGFRDYSNFIRTFKKYEGHSPKELMELSEPI